jgi:hypothetical protein
MQISERDFQRVFFQIQITRKAHCVRSSWIRIRDILDPDSTFSIGGTTSTQNDK